MLSALGYDFMDENGDILPPVFASLEKVVQIENNRVPEVLKDCQIRFVERRGVFTFSERKKA